MFQVAIVMVPSIAKKLVPSNDKICSILTEIPHSEADDCYPLCRNWSKSARPTLFYSGQAWCPFLLVLSARKTWFFEVHDPPGGSTRRCG
jgi:hypothetical protein